MEKNRLILIQDIKHHLRKRVNKYIFLSTACPCISKSLRSIVIFSWIVSVKFGKKHSLTQQAF